MCDSANKEFEMLEMLPMAYAALIMLSLWYTTGKFTSWLNRTPIEINLIDLFLIGGYIVVAIFWLISELGSFLYRLLNKPNVKIQRK
jgi:hypothetical protein